MSGIIPRYGIRSTDKDFAMKNEKRKFFLMLFFAFLLLVAVFFAHAWYTKKGTEKKKATVAVCGKPDKT
jgi:hypothetical protein